MNQIWKSYVNYLKLNRTDGPLSCVHLANNGRMADKQSESHQIFIAIRNRFKQPLELLCAWSAIWNKYVMKFSNKKPKKKEIKRPFSIANTRQIAVVTQFNRLS